jgi:hypothetical protein
MRKASAITFVILALSSAALPAPGSAAVAASEAQAAFALSPSAYDPYAAGNVWTYRTTMVTVFSVGEGQTSKSGAVTTRGTMTTEIVSEQERRPNGDATYETRSTDRSRDDIPGSKEDVLVSESTDLVTKQGSYTLSTKASEQHGGASHKYDQPLFNYPSDIAVGSKWRIGTIWEDKLNYTDFAQVVGTETVDTPAGTFDDCLKVVITHNNMGGSMSGPSGGDVEIGSGQGVLTLWLAKGVGLVKADEISQLKFDDTAHGNVPVLLTSRSMKVLQPGYKVN